MAPIRPADLIDSTELAALLGVKPATLRSMRDRPTKYRRLDGLPPILRTINGGPVWLRKDIDRWLATTS